MKKSSARRLLKNKKGQGMVEYIIVIALVMIAAIGIISLFGKNIRALFAGAVDALGGNTNVSVETHEAAQVQDKNLKDFGENLGASDVQQ